MSGEAITAADVKQAILATFGNVSTQGDGRRYTVALEVNNGAGFSYGRTLDAVVFDTWPSKGLALAGFEVKVSVADLRRELMDPDKSAAFFPYLDTFSIAAPAAVINSQKDSIPSRWGLYAPTEDGRLRTVRKPLYLHDDDGHDRAVLDRSFMAAFTRALVQRSLSREARDLAYEEGRKLGEESKARDLAAAETRLADVAEFEAASGVSLSDYHGGKAIGEAVKFVLKGGLDTRFGYANDLRGLAGRLTKLADELDTCAEKMAMPKDGVLG